MEAVGLTVGLLALVGVFEDCVTLLSQFGAAKSIGKDYSYLATRLDFQRTLLLQWAERLKLYDNKEYDTRLKDPYLKDLIQSGLQCIIQLLQDGHLLQDRYGVRPANIQEAAETSTALSSRWVFGNCTTTQPLNTTILILHILLPTQIVKADFAPRIRSDGSSKTKNSSKVSFENYRIFSWT